MIDFDVAYDKLAGLETADEIADLIRGYGIKALRRNARACAITRWMEEMTGLDISTGVSSTKAVKVIGPGTADYEVDYSRFKSHTIAVAEFINKFDSGFYPDLVEQKIPY